MCVLYDVFCCLRLLTVSCCWPAIPSPLFWSNTWMASRYIVNTILLRFHHFLLISMTLCALMNIALFVKVWSILIFRPNKSASLNLSLHLCKRQWCQTCSIEMFGPLFGFYFCSYAHFISNVMPTTGKDCNTTRHAIAICWSRENYPNIRRTKLCILHFVGKW